MSVQCKEEITIGPFSLDLNELIVQVGWEVESQGASFDALPTRATLSCRRLINYYIIIIIYINKVTCFKRMWVRFPSSPAPWWVPNGNITTIYRASRVMPTRVAGNRCPILMSIRRLSDPSPRCCTGSSHPAGHPIPIRG